MTNKSIRDYINLIENAQLEGYDDEEHPIRDDGNEGRPGKQRYPGKLKEQGVAEGSEQIYNILALDKGNALKKPTKLKWKASSLEDIFDALAAQDWYPLEINGVEVIAGKRLKKSSDEEQLEETSPEAIAKINQITRR